MTVLKCCPKCIRKNSRSKCLFWTASWKIVRESYHQKGHHWKSAQNFILKNCGSKCPYRTASWKMSEKATMKNDKSERLPETVSAKKVHQIVRTGILAKKVSEKTTVKNDRTELLPKMYPQKQSFKMSVPKFYVKKRSKNHHCKCPYWNAVQKKTTRTVVQIVRTKVLAEIAFEELTLKVTVLNCWPKCIRKSSRSKCPYRTASWKIVRESYQQKRHFWKHAQNLIRRNSGSKGPYGNSSWKNVRENYR